METFEEALRWAAEYGITIEIDEVGGTYTVRASRGRISAHYIINMDATDGFRGACWAAITSIRAGTEYHGIHGIAPGLDPGKGEVGT